MNPKIILRLLHGLKACACIAALACIAPAYAAFPDRPIHIVVPYTPGGSSDVIARSLGDELAKGLGQAIVVDNRPGAGSMIGTQYVAGETADGYTLLLVDVPFTIVPALYREKAKYSVEKDFAPVALLGLAPTYLFVSNRFPGKSASDLVRLAKAKPATISAGSGGNGSLTHLMAELFMLNTGTKLVHVPYKGAFAAVTDLAAGQIDVSFTTMASAASLFQAGKLRALAVSSAQRQKSTPDVPTFQESGVSGMNVESWWGLVAPAGTPPAVLGALEQATKKAMDTAMVKARMQVIGVNPPPDAGAVALQTLVKADLARWKDTVSRANIRLE